MPEKLHELEEIEPDELQELDEPILSRKKRLIPTEIVYDQSYPIPESDIPFKDNGLG